MLPLCTWPVDDFQDSVKLRELEMLISSSWLGSKSSFSIDHAYGCCLTLFPHTCLLRGSKPTGATPLLTPARGDEDNRADGTGVQSWESQNEKYSLHGRNFYSNQKTFFHMSENLRRAALQSFLRSTFLPWFCMFLRMQGLQVRSQSHPQQAPP